MPGPDERRQHILNAAAAIISRIGYDKTTMGDIAQEAGASRRTVYLYYNGKDELFEALLYREYLQYSETWLNYIEADPRGGTVGGWYRATMHAVNSHPLIAALMRYDRRVIGSYLHKPDNMFSQMLTGVNTPAFFQSLQAAGAIRRDIDASVIEHIIEVLSYGQLTIGDFKSPDRFPPYDAVMEALADMMDRALQPEPDASADAGTEAGKAVIRNITAAARAQLHKIQQANDVSEQTRDGDTNDNQQDSI